MRSGAVRATGGSSFIRPARFLFAVNTLDPQGSRFKLDDISRIFRVRDRARQTAPRRERPPASSGWIMSPERRGPLLIAPAIVTLFLVIFSR